MKKLVTAIVIASIGAAFAQSVVYDYKASIKRLDLTMKTAKESKKSYVLQKYSVKSDTIQGYVTLPLCIDCNGPVQYSAVELGDGAYAYLTLKGDKFSKVISRPEYLFTLTGTENPNADYEYLYDEEFEDHDIGEKGVKNWLVTPATNKYLYLLKSPADARSAVFGADQNVKTGKIVNPKANKKVWLALDFYMPHIFSLGASRHMNCDVDEDEYAIADVEVVGRLIKKGFAPEPNGKTLVYLGFLGMGNVGFGSDLEDEDGEFVPTKIQNAGFGTLTSDGSDGIESVCGEDVDPTSCNIINTISGTLVGYPYNKGICDLTPMWDFCNPKIMVPESVISGTFSLKLNKKMTKDFAENGEDAFLNKFKVGANYMYEIDEAGYLVDPDKDEEDLLFHLEDN